MAIAGQRAKIVKQGEQIVSVNTKPEANLEGITTYSPKVVERPERTAVVDTGYVDYSRLANSIEGSPYRGVYYSQVVGTDDQLRPQALDADRVSQQYNCYRDMIVRLITPFNPSTQDQESKEFRYVAEANMYYTMPPNKGDMFVADIGNGNTGIITVTETEKLSYTKFSAYRVQLQIVAMNDMDRLRDLEAKSIRTLYYDESLLDYYNTPFLDADTKTKYDTVGVVHGDLREYYLNMFWDDISKTFRIPTDKTMRVFDPLLADYCRYTGLEDIARPATNWAIGALDLSVVQTLWWLLKSESADKIKYVTRDVKLINKEAFRVHYRLRNIGYSRFTHVLYPFEKRPFKNDDEERLTPVEWKWKTAAPVAEFPEPVKDSYVFSHAFYDEDRTKMSKLEYLTYQMVAGDPVPVGDVLMIAKAVRDRSFIEQVYFIPIILTLLQHVRRKPIWL